MENINFGEVLFHKTVDWSIFEWGTTIPVSKVKLFDQIIGLHIERGTHIEIKLLVEGKLYDAKLTNVNRKKVKSDTYQIRYDSNNDLKVLLRDICEPVYEEIKDQRDIAIKKGNQKPYIVISDDNYIEILATTEPRVFSLKVNLDNFYDIESDQFISENVAKQIIDKKSIGLSGEELSRKRKQRLRNYKQHSQKKKKEVFAKVNISNPILKEDIKQLYSYKCQICSTQIKYKGWIPGLTEIEEYDFLSADAHHIVALSENGEDDPSNIICVCPNCHRKLHTKELKILFDDKGPRCLDSINNTHIELNIDESHSLRTRYSR